MITKGKEPYHISLRMPCVFVLDCVSCANARAVEMLICRWLEHLSSSCVMRGISGESLLVLVVAHSVTGLKHA